MDYSAILRRVRRHLLDTSSYQANAIEAELVLICNSHRQLLAENAEMCLALSDRATESEIATAAVRQARKPLLSVLRRLEWDSGEGARARDMCPVCKNYQQDGHLSGCAIGVALVNDGNDGNGG